MMGQLSTVKQDIVKLDLRLKYNNNMIDNWQERLLSNPNLPTTELERYNHMVKEDLSSIRKLESFVKKYEPLYISKPEYPGEERDNVNTY